MEHAGGHTYRNDFFLYISFTKIVQRIPRERERERENVGTSRRTRITDAFILL